MTSSFGKYFGVCVALAAPLTAVVPSASMGVETVRMDFSQPRRNVDHRFIGFLHSLDPDTPGTEYYEVLRPFIHRASRQPTAGPPFWGLERITQAGAIFQYVLSDGVHWTNQPYPGENGDFSIWDQYVDEQIALAKSLGGGAVTGQWDIWNEPDTAGFWPFQDGAGRDRFFETWRRTFVKIRQELPEVDIVGPSFTPRFVPGARTLNYDNFIEYATAHDVVPDVLTIHIFDSQRVERNLTPLREIAEGYGIDEPRIGVNEFAFRNELYRPGVLLHYFSQFEAMGAEYAIHACWPDVVGHACGNTSLDGLLTEDSEPRSTWWVYKKYSEMSGKIFTVQGTDSVTGLAAFDEGAQVAMMILGRDFGETGAGPRPDVPSVVEPVEIDLSGLINRYASADENRPLLLSLSHIPDSGTESLSSPLVTQMLIDPMNFADPLPLPEFGLTDVYAIRIENSIVVPLPATVWLLTPLLGAVIMHRMIQRHRSLLATRLNRSWSIRPKMDC